MSAKSLSQNKYITRYAVRETFKNERGETETAIYLTDKKTACNGSELYKFYAKIGGFLNLQDLNTQKVKDLLKQLDTFGFFLVMANFRTIKGPNTYALVCPQISTKTLEIPVSPLVSFLPRIDGQTGEVICALRISSADDKSKKRDWTRFVGSANSAAFGFHELKFGFNFDDDYKKKTKAKYVGFYVNKNTSLVVYDIGTIDPEKTVNQSQQNTTLIQEGGFVYADADLLFRLCSESEDKLYSAQELYEKFKDSEKSVLGSDRYKKSHLIRDKIEPKHRSVIFFLKSTPLLMPYELHITDDLSKEPTFKGKRKAVLVIPSGGEFEYCDYWQLKDGIETVLKRQKTEPWNKYLQKESDPMTQAFEEKINDIPIMSYPTNDRNEKSPQCEELSKKIKKARKALFGGTGGPKDTKKGATKNNQNEAKTTEETTETKKQTTEAKTPENSGQTPQSPQSPEDGNP